MTVANLVQTLLQPTPVADVPGCSCLCGYLEAMNFLNPGQMEAIRFTRDHLLGGPNGVVADMYYHHFSPAAINLLAHAITLYNGHIAPYIPNLQL